MNGTCIMFTDGEDTFEWLQKKKPFFRVKISLIKGLREHKTRVG